MPLMAATGYMLTPIVTKIVPIAVEGVHPLNFNIMYGRVFIMSDPIA